MDSNVSKNTFFYKFFKLASVDTNLAIKQLLKTSLMEAIELYKQQNRLTIDLNFLSQTIASKIILLLEKPSLSPIQITSATKLSKLGLTQIVYRCAIAFPLGNYVGLPPQIMAKKLIELFPVTRTQSEDGIDFKMGIKVVNSGWLDFYLSSFSLVAWLEKLIFTIEQSSLSLTTAIPLQTSKQTINLFSLQYVHARCCALLRLAKQDKLITLKNNNFQQLTWCLLQPNPLNWLDSRGEFWLMSPTEQYLLSQLVSITDAFAREEESNWVQLAWNLSDAMLQFDANCRIWGEVKDQTPGLAIARLGLVALVQYFLQKIMLTKIGIKPMAEL